VRKIDARVPSISDYGALYLRTDAGDQAALGTTTSGTFSTRVVPGSYDVKFDFGSGMDSSLLPLDTRGKIKSVMFARGSPSPSTFRSSPLEGAGARDRRPPHACVCVQLARNPAIGCPSSSG